MKPELAAAAFGIVMVLFSIAARIRHNATEKRKRINSAKPDLIIELIRTENHSLKIILKNIGVGSAFINTFEAVVNNKSIGIQKGTQLNSMLGMLGLNGLDVLCYVPMRNEKIEPGESCFLIEANPSGSAEYSKIESALMKLSFRINYQSIYGIEYTLN